ncbi:uncharacterized protein LOC117480942 [Scomber scombrus]|uniref:Uncharacterized protein LOC117480942 n=1 Tax=Scomber scombrus TaxID=13677 RepID=A0AAV1QAB6_SCOSC
MCEFYGGVMGAAHELCDKVFSQAHDHDVIQMELRSDCFTKSVSSIVRPSQDDSGGLVTFQNLLDELVQANMALMTDGGLELVVQLIRNPRGGSKRRLDSMIDSEVVKKRRKFLYVVENPDNRLCFAINLALLLNPYITDGEAERKGREIQRAVGLSEQTDVGFTDVSLFENYLDCKIVVFYRSEGKRSLCKFLTATPRKDKTVFLFLHQNHYYGIKNLKSFLGTAYLCDFCYTGYTSVCNHRCNGHCSVCLDPLCCKLYFSPCCAKIVTGRAGRRIVCLSTKSVYREPREQTCWPVNAICISSVANVLNYGIQG